MFCKTKLTAAAIGAACLSLVSIQSAHAEPSKSQEVSDAQSVRRAIVGAGWPSIMIGASTELIREEDIQAMVSDLLPFTNNLSKQTRTAVTVVPNRDDRIFQDDIKNKRYRYVFCELRDCFIAISQGYVPIAKREDMQKAILITRASENIKREDQLPKNARIGFYGDGILRVMASAFKSVSSKPLIDLNSFSQAAVASQMFDGRVDAMVVSSNDLAAVTGNHPAQFGSAAKSEPVPNALLLARPDVASDEAARFVDAFVNATPETISQMFLTPDIRPGFSTFQAINKVDKETISFVYKRSASIKRIDAKNQSYNQR